MAGLRIFLRLRLHRKLLVGNNIGEEKAFNKMQVRNRGRRDNCRKKHIHNLAIHGRFAYLKSFSLVSVQIN